MSTGAGQLQLQLQAVKDSVAVGISTGLHFVAMSRNYRELPEVCSLARDLGASGVSVLRFVPQGRGRLLMEGELDRLQSLELKRTIQRLRAEGHTIRTGSPLNHLWLNDPPECMSAIDRLIVAADGRVYPCDAFKHITAESVAGTAEFSVLGSDCALGDAWERSPYLAAVRAMVERDRERPCVDCESLRLCGSGCLAQKMIVDGRLHAGMDPGCLKRQSA